MLSLKKEDKPDIGLNELAKIFAPKRPEDKIKDRLKKEHYSKPLLESRLLPTLKNQGWINKKKDKKHSQKQNYSITENGERFIERYIKPMRAWIEKAKMEKKVEVITLFEGVSLLVKSTFALTTFPDSAVVLLQRDMTNMIKQIGEMVRELKKDPSYTELKKDVIKGLGGKAAEKIRDDILTELTGDP